MKILKFINMFYKIKANFCFLPKGLQDDLIEDLEDYYALSVMSKYEKMKGEK